MSTIGYIVIGLSTSTYLRLLQRSHLGEIQMKLKEFGGYFDQTAV